MAVFFTDLFQGTGGLYYFNARYYDPAIGRFINVDPIQDGSNWYVYCRNNPLSMVDPTGLKDYLLHKYSFKANIPDVETAFKGSINVNRFLDGNPDNNVPLRALKDSLTTIPEGVGNMLTAAFAVDDMNKTEIRNKNNELGEWILENGNCEISIEIDVKYLEVTKQGITIAGPELKSVNAKATAVDEDGNTNTMDLTLSTRDNTMAFLEAYTEDFVNDVELTNQDTTKYENKKDLKNSGELDDYQR